MNSYFPPKFKESYRLPLDGIASVLFSSFFSSRRSRKIETGSQHVSSLMFL